MNKIWCIQDMRLVVQSTGTRVIDYEDDTNLDALGKPQRTIHTSWEPGSVSTLDGAIMMALAEHIIEHIPPSPVEYS